MEKEKKKKSSMWPAVQRHQISETGRIRYEVLQLRIRILYQFKINETTQVNLHLKLKDIYIFFSHSISGEMRRWNAMSEEKTKILCIFFLSFTRFDTFLLACDCAHLHLKKHAFVPGTFSLLLRYMLPTIVLSIL